jgi:exodeoxyribonuclease III
MIQIVSLNLNGIRSATNKGWLSWLENQAADVVCVQELKAQDADLTDEMRAPVSKLGKMTGYFHFAEKKGYSGVAVYARKKPNSVKIGFGSHEFDAEGRYVELDFGEVTVISLYLPSGSSGEERQAAKFRFLAEFYIHMQALVDSGRQVVLCGDWNIAHKEIDLKNWRGNKKNSGFLPEERQWLTNALEVQGFVDVFRVLDQRPEQYTWWSNRGQAYANNVGWRLDYQLATPIFAAKAKSTSIYVEQRFSDHAPMIVNYTGTL